MTSNSFKKQQAEATDRYCQAFIQSSVTNHHFDEIASLMRQFKNNQNKANTLQIFIKLHTYVKSTNNKALEDQFNRCLVPEAFMKEENKEKPKSTQNIQNHPITHREKPIPPPLITNKSSSLVPIYEQEITEQVFMRKMHGVRHFNRFGKVVYLYLKCIITLSQLKQFSAKLLPKNLYAFFIGAATDIQAPRRNGSVFVSLNQLCESELKNRIGASYVQMPSGYANHCNDHTLPEHVKKTLNRQWVSMPLGTQFKNTKKNEYQEEMFKLQQERFEIDITINSFRKCLKQIKLIEQTNQFQPSNLLQRTLYRIYGTGQVYDFLQRKPEQTAKIIYSRVQEKLKQIENCRKKSIKTWDEAAYKNFQKSLDHRSFYFESYEKKFNLSTARWDKQTQFKHQYYSNPLVLNPQNFSTSFNSTVDTFENITKQKCRQSAIVDLNFSNSNSFIKFPYNKILYVFDFSDTDTLNDVIGIIGSRVNKRSTLQYLLLKLLKIDVTKIFENFQQKMKKFQKFREIETMRNNQIDSIEDEQDLVTTKKQKKKIADIGEQFFDMISEEPIYMAYKATQSPFQGPPGNVFIGTKSMYHFMRYLLVIYQRFIKAKQMISALEKDDQSKTQFLPGERYDRLKNVLMSKSRDVNQDETIRKIFDKNAFMFLTLNKLVERASRIINNPDDVSVRIIKEDMRDYDCGIKKIERYQIRSQLEQLMRVYHQPGVFYRFCWTNDLLYISSWSSIYKDWDNKSQILSRIHSNFNNFASNPMKPLKQQKQIQLKLQGSKKRSFQEIQSQYLTAPNDMLLLQKGYQFYRTTPNNIQINLNKEMKRLKKINQILNI